jgi:hypothetical protein
LASTILVLRRRPRSLKGLHVYLAEGDAPPAEIVPPPPSPMKYWTRRGIAEWLVELGALPPGAETARWEF